MESYSVKFNGNEISLVSGVILYNHEFNTLPSRDIKIYKIARRDKSIITSAEYSQKPIEVYLDACSGDRAATEDTLTFLKSLLQAQSAPLIVSQGGEEVEYTATMNEFNITWLGARAIVVIVFIASDPIGRQTDVVTLANIPSITTANYTLSVTVQGSAIAYPITSFTYTTITGGTNKTVYFANGLTNQGISIKRNWVSGDFLQIDSDRMEATVNGVLYDFTGMFPQFPAGSQQLMYMDDFTTRNFALLSTYQPRLV